MRSGSFCQQSYLPSSLQKLVNIYLSIGYHLVLTTDAEISIMVQSTCAKCEIVKMLLSGKQPHNYGKWPLNSLIFPLNMVIFQFAISEVNRGERFFTTPI